MTEAGANQWTGFYMITASVMKELRITLKAFKDFKNEQQKCIK